MREFVVANDLRKTLSIPSRVIVGGPNWMRPTIRWIAKRWISCEVDRIECTRMFVPASGDIIRRMHLNARDMEYLYNERAKYAFIGPDVLNDMHSELRKSRMIGLGTFQFPMNGISGIKIIGIEIILVPWMDGALLVHDWRKQ